MVKKFLAIVLAICLFANTAVASNFTRKEVRFTRTVAAETKLHQKDANRHDLLVYSKSCLRVAKMFPSFPEEGVQGKVAKFMAWGGIESVWTPSYVNVNIPKAKYASGKVRVFSVDYGWTGVNSENVNWTYEVANAIQQKRELPKYLSPELRGLLRSAKIPKKLKLKRIDLSTAVDAKHQWKALLKQGVHPDKMASKIFVPYEELTEDDVDSLLIYRVIVEMDRSVRGWKEGAHSKGLYEKLKSLDLGL